MTLEEYRLRYKELNNKIKEAQSNLETELVSSSHVFNQLYKEKQEKDKLLFIDNLSSVLRHKDYIKKSSLANIVIDFLLPYYQAGMAGGAGFSTSSNFKIYLKDLINMWENGFLYNGCPILEYKIIIHNNRKLLIEYVKDNTSFKITFLNKDATNAINYYAPIIEKLKSLNINKHYQNWETHKTISALSIIYTKKDKPKC